MLNNFDDSVIEKRLSKEKNVLVVPPDISAGIKLLLGSENHFHLCVYTAIM
jgi:hypothetical protein